MIIWRLPARLTMPMAILLTAMLSGGVAFWLASSTTTAAELERARTEEVHALARLQTAVLTAVRRGDHQAVRSILKSAGTDADLTDLVLLGPDGRVTASLRVDDEGRQGRDLDLRLHPELVAAMEAGRAAGVVRPDGEHALQGYTEVCQVVGHGGHLNRVCSTLIAKRDLSGRVAAAVSGVRVTAVGTIVSTLFLSLGLLVFFDLNFGRRTQALVNTARRFGAGDDTARARLTGEDELGVIGGALDRLLDDVVQSRADLEEAERARRHTQRLEALGQLTGGVAHDFNNYMAAILPTLELASSETDDPGMVELLGVALDAAHGARSLTQRLMAFGGRSTLQPKCTDLGALVEGSMRLLRSSLGEGVKLVLALPDEPVVSKVDPGELESALMNLALNARDATQGGGRIHIGVSGSERAAPDEAAERSWARISVSDTGSGMAPDILEKAFDPFFSTRIESGGTGLGLSMVQGFVAQSGGFVEARSEVGVGTRIDLYLPVASEPVAVATPAPQPSRAVSQACILLVEDNVAVRTATARVLRRLGYQVTSVPDAGQALAALREGPPFGLMLSDIVLPGPHSGIDLAALVRQEFPEVRVILATGHSERQVDDVHIDGLLRKPFDIAELSALVAQVLAGSPDSPMVRRVA